MFSPPINLLAWGWHIITQTSTSMCGRIQNLSLVTLTWLSCILGCVPVLLSSPSLWCHSKSRCYGISPAELSPGLRTGRAGGSHPTPLPSQECPHSPCHALKAFAVCLSWPPTFITPGASSAASDTSHQPWLLSCSVEGSQRGSGSALCMQGQGCWLSTGPCTSQAVQTSQLPSLRPQRTSHGISIACTCPEIPSAVSLESLRTSLVFVLLDISTPGESQERHFTLCSSKTQTFYSHCGI